jgi:ribosome-associated toxin RatA of RatAB toxin-antitoxin module
MMTRVAAALALAFLGSANARPQLDSERMSRLDRYDVLAFGDPFKNGFEMGKAIGVFDATAEEVFRVATDYTKWKEYLPRVRNSEVRDRKRDGATVEITLDLPWPVGNTLVTAKYRHEKLKGEIYRVQFQKVRGNLKQYLGSLYIEPYAPGKCAVTYALVAQPELLAPKSMVNRAVQKSASGFVNALRQRVNDLHKWGLLHPEMPAQKAVSPLNKPPAERAVQAEAAPRNTPPREPTSSNDTR